MDTGQEGDRFFGSSSTTLYQSTVRDCADKAPKARTTSGTCERRAQGLSAKSVR